MVYSFPPVQLSVLHSFFVQLILILRFTLYGHFTQTNSATAAPLTLQSLMAFGAIKRAVRRDAPRACGEGDTREDPLWADGEAFNAPRLVSGWPLFQSPALPAGDTGSYCLLSCFVGSKMQEVAY